jgi:hypothetical protein
LGAFGRQGLAAAGLELIKKAREKDRVFLKKADVNFDFEKIQIRSKDFPDSLKASGPEPYASLFVAFEFELQPA